MRTVSAGSQGPEPSQIRRLSRLSSAGDVAGGGGAGTGVGAGAGGGGVGVEGDGGDALGLLMEDGVGGGEDAAEQEADGFAGVGAAPAGEQARECGRALGFDSEAFDLGGVLLGEGLGAALEGAEQDAGAAEELAHAWVVGEEELVEAVGAVCLDEGLGGLDDFLGRALAGLWAGVGA